MESHESSRGEPLQALVVEDDPDVRDFLISCLENDGFEVTSCFEGPTAIACLASRHFDLVVIDVFIPHPHGLMVLARMRSEIGPNAETPVIVCTGFLTGETRRAPLPIAGADAVLPKPVSAAHLLGTVRSLLSCHRRAASGM